MAFVPHAPARLKVGSTSGYDVDAVAFHPAAGVAASFEATLSVLAWPSLAKVAKLKGVNGSCAFTPSGDVLYAHEAKRLVAIEPRTGRVQREVLAGESALGMIVPFADGERVLVGMGRDTHVVDRAGARRVTLADVPRYAAHAAVSPDGRLVAVRCQSDVTIHDARTGARLAALAGIAPLPAHVAFTADGMLVTCLDAAALGFWAEGAWSAPARTVATKSPAIALAASPSGALAFGDGLVVRVLTADGASESEVRAPDARAVALHGDVLVVGVGKEIAVWTRGGGARVVTAPAPPAVALRVAEPRSAPQGAELAAALTTAPWLSRLGTPPAASAGVKPLDGLDAWPGPDHAGVAAFLELLDTLSEASGEALGNDDGMYERVHAAAAARVPSSEPFPAPSAAAPLVVALLAQIAHRYATLGWPLPPAIESALAYALDGHLPAGFAKKPGKAPLALFVI